MDLRDHGGRDSNGLIRAVCGAAVAGILLAACARSSSLPVETDAGDASQTGAPVALATAAASTSESPDASAAVSVPDASLPCPGGMLLVDGDYCSRLELTCKKEELVRELERQDDLQRVRRAVEVRREQSPQALLHGRVRVPESEGRAPAGDVQVRRGAASLRRGGQARLHRDRVDDGVRGAEYKPYPYGYARDPKICNGDRQYVEPTVVAATTRRAPLPGVRLEGTQAVAKPELERLWQGVESGSQPQCVSDYGVWDMPGNADELASSETPEPDRASSTTSRPAARGSTASATSAGPRSTRTTRASRTTTSRRAAAQRPTARRRIPAHRSRSRGTRSGDDGCRHAWIKTPSQADARGTDDFGDRFRSPATRSESI